MSKLSMKDKPKLNNIIKNDTGVFICVWLPILFGSLAVSSFIYFESDRNNYTIIEILYLSPVIFIGLSLCLWPFVLWWRWSISETFKNGVELEAINTNKRIKHAFDLGVVYQFEHNGNIIEHIASLVPNAKTKEIASMQSFNIVFNPKRNISFIKNAYI